MGLGRHRARLRLGLIALLLAAPPLAGCQRSAPERPDADSDADVAAPATNVADLAPAAPAADVAPVASAAAPVVDEPAPPPIPSEAPLGEDEQVRDDADAAGMTSRAVRGDQSDADEARAAADPDRRPAADADGENGGN